MTLLLKAQVKNGAAGDLFATIPTEVHVRGHLRADTHGARFVLPYVGVRHKAPAKPLPEVDLPLFVVRAPPPPPPEPLLIITPEPPAPSEPLLVIKRKAQSGKLREAADKIIAAANESLGRDRQANTRKRVQQAAIAIADAQREERIGQTMRNLADKPALNPEDAEHLAIDTELRQLLHLNGDLIMSYVPTNAVTKLGKRWRLTDVNGKDWPLLFDTRQEALEQGEKHIALIRDMYMQPRAYHDVVALRASKRLEDMR